MNWKKLAQIESDKFDAVWKEANEESDGIISGLEILATLAEDLLSAYYPDLFDEAAWTKLFKKRADVTLAFDEFNDYVSDIFNTIAETYKKYEKPIAETEDIFERLEE